MKNFFTLLLLFSSFFGFSQATLPLTRTNWGSTPTGWTDSGTGNYSSSFACSGNDMGQLNSSGDSYTVYFDSSPNLLAYTLKVSGATSSSCLVQKSDDGNTWITVVNHTSLPTTCTVYSYSLGVNVRYVRWTYTKVIENLGLDDVSITKTLPVSLTKFNAFFQNRQVNLNWSMANASNFDRFEVEHSTNGVDFTTLQSISTRNTMDYATTDANPAKGINYYRLKMMDLDGSFSYSEVKTVKVASETVWSVSPTKSSSLLTATVNENEESTIQLFNTNGQLVYNTIQNGNPKVEIPIGNLTSGIYIVRISVSGSVVYSERIIKE